MAGAGVRAPLAAAHQHNAGPSAGHHAASAPGPGLPPGTVRFCAVPALSLGKFSLMLMVPGISGLGKRSRAGRQGHAPPQYDLRLNSNTLENGVLA